MMICTSQPVGFPILDRQWQSYDVGKLWILTVIIYYMYPNCSPELHLEGGFGAWWFGMGIPASPFWAPANILVGGVGRADEHWKTRWPGFSSRVTSDRFFSGCIGWLPSHFHEISLGRCLVEWTQETPSQGGPAFLHDQDNAGSSGSSGSCFHASFLHGYQAKSTLW